MSTEECGVSGVTAPNTVATEPSTPEQVLEAGLTAHFKRPVRIAEMDADSFWAEAIDRQIDRLRVTLESGEVLQMIFKRFNPEPGLEHDSHEALKDYKREVLVYRRLLCDPNFGAPALYASAYDPTREQYWLFMEDLGESTLDHKSLKHFLATAGWLGRMHGAYAGRQEELRRLGCLVEHDQQFYRALGSIAHRNFQVAGEKEDLERFEGLRPRFESAAGDLLRQPRTLLHGDFAPHNVIIEPDGRIRPLDWEWAAVGPVGWDLAGLYYEWQSDQADFLAAYAREFQRHSAISLDDGDIERAYSLCEVVYKLWILAMNPERFPHPGYVGRLLDKMEHAWDRLQVVNG